MSIGYRSLGSILAGVSAAFVASIAGDAQAFESVFGATPDLDTGGRGVAPVRFCAGGGFISAGTRTSGGASDVYVVRTNAAGGLIFERRYDIGPGFSDRGNAIVELRGGAGFAIAGSTNAPGATEDALLLRIDCNGNPAFALTYGGALRDVAADLIEATSGNAAAGTAPGDLILAGFTTHPAGNNTDGFLLRVKSSGALIWNRRYDVNSVNEAFASLAEVRPTLVSPTGDIAVAGSWKSGAAPEQGYALRVSGDNGSIGGGSTCAAIYGGPDAERFTSVVESRVGGTAGQLVFGGSSSSAAQASDIYLARTQANPCTAVLQRRIGAPAASPLGDESAADMRQLTAGIGIGVAGSLVLTGAVGRIGTAAYEAYLLPADVTTLIPGAGRLFGDHASRRDQGMSLFQVPAPAAPGIVIGGFSDSDFQGVGDLRDMYIVRTDGAGNTTCNQSFTIPHAVVTFPPTALMVVSAPFAQPVQRSVTPAAQNTGFLKCP